MKLLGLLLVLCSLALGRAQVPIEVQGLVAISTEGIFTCTGWVAKKDIVITAAHCVDNDTTPLVAIKKDPYVPFKILFRGESSSATDFAILQGNTQDLEPLPLADKNPAHGQTIFFLSMRRGIKALLPGTYTSIDTIWSGCLLFFGFVIPGDSGGPLIDETNRVAGVVIGYQATPGEIRQGMAVPIENVLKKLAEVAP